MGIQVGHTQCITHIATQFIQIQKCFVQRTIRRKKVKIGVETKS